MADIESGPRAEARTSPFLSELAALRAFGVLAVLLFHLWPTRLPGGFIGVDVLFVVSGYLITGLLVRELDSTGTLRIRAFFGRRLARLAPSALLVAGTVAVAVVLFLPRTQWLESARQAIASALYAENWYLIRQSADYVAANAGPTVFQHYWSLGVEGQLYVVWPFLLLVGGFLVSRAMTSMPWRWRARIVLLVIVAASLLCSFLLRHSGGTGYFSTLTRAWEFAGGGLLALGLPRLPTVVRALVAVVGWAGLGASSVIFGPGTAFPGYVALLPVAATAFVIVGGAFAPYRARAIDAVATISYSLYLWHWPVIVLWPALIDRAMTWSDRLAAGSVSLGLAALTTVLVERRFWTPTREGPVVRRRRVTAATAFSVLAAIALVAASAGQIGLVKADQSAAIQALDRAAAKAGPCFGAAALVASNCPPETAPTAAAIEFAADDWGEAWNLKPHGLSCVDSVDPLDGGSRRCSYGDATSATTVAIVGDSHAAQWIGPMMSIADSQHWHLELYDRGGCPVLDASGVDRFDTLLTAGCDAWATSVVAEVAADPRIDDVITSGYFSAYGPEAATTGITQMTGPQLTARVESAVTKWLDAGKKVLMIGDTPHAPSSIPDCLAKARAPLTDCTYTWPSGPTDTTTPAAASALAGRGVVFADPVTWMCPTGRCSPVIGGLIAYVDDDHMSGTFARTMVGRLSERLIAAGWVT